jgi:putative heme-binding domain-containing protein
LRKHPENEVRQLAELVLTSGNKQRDEVIRKYQAALKLKGNAERGLEVFRAHCLACHQHKGQGHELGPTLGTVRNHDPGAVLIQILDPNREVLAGYLQYFVTLDDGRTVTGRIVNETAAGLTLRRAGGVEESISRRRIKTITSSGRSLMPEGFEATIDQQSMSDLLAFLGS